MVVVLRVICVGFCVLFAWGFVCVICVGFCVCYLRGFVCVLCLDRSECLQYGVLSFNTVIDKFINSTAYNFVMILDYG